MRVFIDSNIPMYVAGRDHPLRDPARRLLERVRSGELEGCTSTGVLQEILYRYSALTSRYVGTTFSILLPRNFSRISGIMPD